ncbi:hypothetical protein [Biostraticola tofi]|uniref:Concanavalin A-like lectin/glucanase superfamily protein n=1 Tax=Biostraticola tofi TaxID=466109 RepID=A0A4R3Z5M6_9GAMM|nr:hypothetical protein [Biostraticola tofi]TCW00379.1 hypothetical protein EDC52_101729 [Biostraticola tofi]
MATRLINKNAVLWASPKSKLSIPFPAAWEGYFSFGIDAATSIRNLIRDKAALSVVGTPTYDENYIELTGAQVAYLVTAIKNSTDMTIIASVMPLEEKGIAVMSNYQSNRKDETGLCIGTTLGFDVGADASDGNVITRFNHGVLINGVSSGAAAETATGAQINQWYLIGGRVLNTARVRTVYNLSAGTTGTNTPALNDADLGDVMRIGSAYSNQFPGKVRLCELAIWSEYLSDTKFSTAAQFMRESATKKGVIV